jgi:hypothetical protein
MTDKEKLKVVNAIVSSAYEWQPDEKEIRGAFFEGVMSSICAVMMMGEGETE